MMEAKAQTNASQKYPVKVGTRLRHLKLDFLLGLWTLYVGTVVI